MIRKIFEKHETAAVITLIVLYVGVNSVCLQSYETTDIHSALVNTAFSAFLLSLVCHLKRTEYYGLRSVRGAKRYLFFAPLVLIASVKEREDFLSAFRKRGTVLHVLIGNAVYGRRLLWYVNRRIEKPAASFLRSIGHDANGRQLDNAILTR